MKHLLHKLSSMRLLMLLTVLLGMGSSAAWADDGTSTLTFTAKCNGSGTADDGASWTVASDGTESNFDNTKGIHYGTNSAQVQYIRLSTSDISGTITEVVVNASTASGVTATASVTVGGNAFGGSAQSLTTSAANYTFTGSASGEIVVTVTKPSKAAKAIYVKSIAVTYSTGGTPTLDDSDLALTGAPIALNFDLYNSSAAQTVTFTTSSTGEVTVSGGEGYVTTAVSGNTITVMPTAVTPSAQTITVSQAADDNYKAGEVTFTISIDDSTPLPTHTATFSVNGAISSQDFEEGEAIVFPGNPADISSKTFVGWVTDAISGVTDTAPSFVTSATMGNSDVTYYAVFAYVDGDSEAKSLEITKTTPGVPTTYGTANTFSEYTFGGVKFQVMQMYNNERLQWRAAGNSNGTGTMYNSESLEKISSIVLTYNDGDKNKNFTLKIGGSVNPTDGESITPTVNGLVYTFDCSSYNYGYFVLTNGEYAGYLDQITINYTVGSLTYSGYCTTVVAAAVERPEIAIAENPFLFSTTTTITCETEGAVIKYSFDGETWNDYTDALTITETTTIYAKAVKDENVSEIATVTATKNLAAPTVTIDATGITNTNVYAGTEAGSLAATVTYNEAAVEGAIVTWSGDNDEVATIDASTGAVTLVAAGTVTFTATYAGNSDYSEKTATYEMTVTNQDPNAPGSENNPYTVAQAIAATPASGTSDYVYIRGVVSQFYSTSIMGDGSNYRYYISDDGGTDNQLLVYKGKGLGNVAFSDADDLQIGDVVTIVGGLNIYKSAPQVASGNYIVTLNRKADSDFAITSDTEVALQITSSEMHPTSSITYDTSSTGDVIFVSNDDAVVTVSDAGLITAQGEGTTTITVMQDGDNNYKASAEMIINVTVTDNRSAVATDIDLPAEQKTLKVGDMDNFAVISSVDAGFTGTVVYTYETSDASIVDVDEGTFSAEAPGTADITITATPTDGNAANYKSASQVVTVTVKGTTTLELSDTEDIETFGTPIVFTATIADGYDGVLLTESSNDLVATAAIEGTTITVTSQAVGTAVITVTAPETEVFAGEVSKYFSVEFVQPAGLTEVSANGFTKVTATEDITDGEYLIVYEDVDGSVAFDGSLETLDAANNTIDVEINEGVIAATDETKAATFTIDTTAGTLQSMSGYYIGKTANSNGLDSNTETQYTNTFEIDGAGNAVITASGGCVLKYNSASNQNRFRYYKSGQQDIQLYKFADASATVTINKYGYATYCSVNPMDFSSTEGYTAWRVNSISNDGIITYKKITTAIKGGQGVLLYNKDADDENTTKVTVTFADGDTEFDNGSDGNDENDNLLIGTTALTYVAEASVYGLYGSSFVKSSEAGLIPAGKAYIEATEIPAGVKNFTFVFEDETTGITETRQATREEVESIFNLGGQRMSKLQRGINIVNGRKVLVK